MEGYIRTLEENDVDGMLEWMHDSSINCFFNDKIKESTRQSALEFIKAAVKAHREGKEYCFAITDEGGNYMGSISLKNIDRNLGTAEYAIAARKCAHGKGYAIKATQELFDFAFKELYLNKIQLNVVEDNLRAIRFYEKCGFVQEKELSEDISVLIDGRRKEQRRYVISKQDWISGKR